eukprot:CAMPEP_0119313894 /NCGR_PEP_ID=MMETSP1333-20130426/30814_1 /TAXON_ID=418940 /ORGANISM="Scyphosphaera apsteinii, Strain RCC1455" /LENGTH=203 /DNA_ID=CAMNT_0007318869 /DNA_START=59 /DNA_END=670 /DNA_ORIENTATION=+
MTRGAVAASSFFNTFFITSSLIDYSIDLWATSSTAGTVESKLAFLGHFYSWRASPPVIGSLLLLLMVLLPFVVYSMIKEAVLSCFGWRHASKTRHAADIIQAVTLLLVILPMLVATVMPAQTGVVEACMPSDNGLLLSLAECQIRADSLLPQHQAMLLLNLLMFGCDIAKMADGLPVSIKDDPVSKTGEHISQTDDFASRKDK